MRRREALHRLVDLLDQRKQRLLEFLLVHRLTLVEPGSIVVSFQPSQKAETRLREVRAHTSMVAAGRPASRHTYGRAQSLLYPRPKRD